MASVELKEVQSNPLHPDHLPVVTSQAVPDRDSNGSVEDLHGHSRANASVPPSPSLKHDENHHIAVVTTTIPWATFNFVNSIVGAGIIGLPYSLRRSGLWLGTFLLISVALVTDASVRMLVSCGDRMGEVEYESLALKVLGKSGFVGVSIAMFIFAFGAMIAYLVIIGDTLTSTYGYITGESVSRELVIVLVALITILPLCMLREMASLSRSSFVSVAADVILVGILVVAAPITARNSGEYDPDFAKTDYFQPTFAAGLATMSFAYTCHHSSFIVHNALKDPTPQRWGFTTHISISTALLLSLIISYSVYLSFGHHTESDALNNFGDDNLPATICRVLLAITMILTYPMEQFVARHSVYALIEWGPYEDPLASQFKHTAVTLSLWTVSVAIALVSSNLGVVLEMTGAVGASLLGYIFPALIYYKVYHNGYQRFFEGLKRAPLQKEAWKDSAAYVPALLLGVGGCYAMVAGTYEALSTA